MKAFFFSLATMATLTSLTACNRDDTPQPVEEELITTLQLLVMPDSGGIQQTFVYKVENGFGNTTPGTIRTDTLLLKENRNYNVQISLLNEKESPAEDVTTEVINERDDHLFLYSSSPTTGPGSVTASNGNVDNQNRPFNQTVRLTTSGAGNGTLTVTLLHNPADKSAASPASAGGETDVEATFPVRLVP